MILTLFMPCLQLCADFVQKTALHRKDLTRYAFKCCFQYKCRLSKHWI